ncbi:MAG: acyl-CoA carboxylase epsilon subunit [Nocardioidaceae bacterium]
MVAARASVDPGRSSGDDSVWSDRGRLVRAPLHAGPGAWRASVLPR